MGTVHFELQRCEKPPWLLRLLKAAARTSSMILIWSVCQLVSEDSPAIRRQLFLDTRLLKPVERAAVESTIELMDDGHRKDIVRFRHLFLEKEPTLEDWDQINSSDCDCRSFTIPDYFEDEQGHELSGKSLVKKLTGKTDAIVFHPGATPYQIDYALSQAGPIRTDQILLSAEHVDTLALFCRDLTELMNSQLFKCGPGQFTSGNEFQTAVSHEEIGSFVSIFRRLYMTKEPANFSKAVTAFTSAVQGHPVSNLVSGYRNDYEKALSAPPELVTPFLPDRVSFDRKRLLDIFIYTQYAHQPSPLRKQQYKECLAELSGDIQLLSWLFATEIWKCSLTIANGGQYIRSIFQSYCKFNRVNPDEIRSMTSDCPGIGSLEKHEQRKERIRHKALLDLATQLWHEAGRPTCGPEGFMQEARKHLEQLLD